MRLHFRSILHIMGLVSVFNGIFMLTCMSASFYYNESDWNALLISGLITIVFGSGLWLLTKQKKHEELSKRDGYLIVTLGWITMTLFGTLPYIISGVIPSYTNAFFETMSGYTTTGATILDNIEALPKGILLWRSLTQWIGGMGIIVLAVAILPILGIGGMQMFVAETPGISPDKLAPRITATAKRLWGVYFILTFLEMVILKLEGMSIFDAVNHSFTTMATGGFSTKQESIGYFNSPAIQYTIMAFMFVGGTNFTLIYFGLRGRFRRMIQNEEFRFYSLIVLAVGILVSLGLVKASFYGWEESFRHGFFQTISIITTTGYTTQDYTLWSPFLLVLIFLMMFYGGSAGSTSGGIKIVRRMLLLKNAIIDLKRQLHPSAIISLRFNNREISQDLMFNVLAFTVLYAAIFGLGFIFMSFMGVDFTTSMGCVASALGNVGPAIGGVGPSHTFSLLPDIAKWFLSFLMLVGRLELFTVLMLLTPYFWGGK